MLFFLLLNFSSWNHWQSSLWHALRFWLGVLVSQRKHCLLTLALWRDWGHSSLSKDLDPLFVFRNFGLLSIVEVNRGLITTIVWAQDRARTWVKCGWSFSPMRCGFFKRARFLESLVGYTLLHIFAHLYLKVLIIVGRPRWHNILLNLYLGSLSDIQQISPKLVGFVLQGE